MGGVIHVGAWDGREYVDQPGPLLLFEPQARPFADLERNLGVREDVTLLRAAAGAQEGTAIMHSVWPDHSSSLICPRWLINGFSLTGQEEVDVTTVDQALDKHDLHGQFDLLRIDTQGFELEVLKGATGVLSEVSRVETEIHNGDTYPGAAQLPDVDAFLAEHGFVRVHFGDREGDDPTAWYERIT